MGSQKQAYTSKQPKREVHSHLINIPVRKVLLTITQTGKQKLPERAETSGSGINFSNGKKLPAQVVARTDIHTMIFGKFHFIIEEFVLWSHRWGLTLYVDEI